jgi:hypothetical protein
MVAPMGVVATGAEAALARPTLASPTSGSKVAANPLLSWNARTGAVRYEVQVSSRSDFSSTSIEYSLKTLGTRATPTNDLKVGAHWWRVRAVDAKGVASAYSASSSFVRSSPNAPSVIQPANGAVLTYPTQPLVLAWTPMAGAKSYDVQIDDDALFVGAASPVSTTNASYTPANPPLNTAFYWRVRGKSSSGVPSQYSAPRSYRMTWTGRPVQTAPANTNSPTIEEIVLDWKPLTGASAYELQISPDKEFNAPIGGTQVVRATSFAPSITLPNGAYFWRVRGLTTASKPEPGLWSPTWVFTRAWPGANAATQPQGVVNDAHSQVTLLAPADKDYTLTEPTLSWSPQREASHYELQVGTDVYFSPGRYGICLTNRTTFTTYLIPLNTSPCKNLYPVKIPPGQVLFWRVRAVDGPSPVAVNGVWSEVRSFLYDAPAVHQTSPPSGTTTSLPVLRWDFVPNVSRYQVMIRPATADLNCPPITVFTHNTTYVPETLNLACSQTLSWFVRPVEYDGDLSRSLPQAFWPTFRLQTAPLGSTLGVVRTTAGETYRPPLMTWSPVNGAARYTVSASVAGARSFMPLNVGTTLPALAYTGENGGWGKLLSPGTYDFYVEAFDSKGGWLGISEPGPLSGTMFQQFTIKRMRNVALRGPANCLPDGCKVLLHDTPTLDWDPVQDAGYYMVYLATDPAFTHITRVWATGFSTLTPVESLPDSQAGQATYWYVRPCFDYGACDAFDPSVFGGAFAFRKQSFPITTISPRGGAVVPDEVTFEWQDYLVTNRALAGSEKVDQEARNYRVQVSTTAEFTNIIDTSPFVDQTRYTAQTRTYPDGPLFCRVQAYDNSNNPLTFSPVVAFSKSSPGPTQSAPADTARVSEAPVLRWAPKPFGNTYEVEVYKNPGSALSATNRVLSLTTRSTAAIPVTPLAAGAYGWRVRRLDVNGLPGRWTADINTGLRRFTVVGGLPTPLSPAKGSTVRRNGVLLHWTAVRGASRYVVEVSRSSTFSPLLQSVRTDMTYWAPGLVSPSWPLGTVYWRVRTLDAKGGVLATSSRWSAKIAS